MDKINKISFKGISNIGSIECKRTMHTASDCLSMLLKDDFNGKDLTEFKSVIKKITQYPEDYRNNYNSDVLNIECLSAPMIDKLEVNGMEVPVNDESLPLFSYIAKLTRRIAKMPEEKMIVNADYVKKEAAENLVYGVNLGKGVEDNAGIKITYDWFFNKSDVKEGAQRINNKIQSIMNKYFNI